jgi:cytochrome c
VAQTGGQGAFDAGQRAIQQCRVCHQMTSGGPPLSGPSLEGVFGRKAGTMQGYAFSAALSASGIIWDDSSLDSYLAAPTRLVPGTKMVMRMPDPKARAAVIAFLKSSPNSKPAASDRLRP